MTVDEIRNITFSKGRGYRADEVDDFIDACVETVENLTKENTELLRKIKILANKVLEYRNQQADAQPTEPQPAEPQQVDVQAVLSKAQETGEKFIEDAKAQAAKIIEDANAKAKEIQTYAQLRKEKEEQKCQHLQQQAELFKSCVLSVYREQMELFEKLPVARPEEEEEPEAEPAPVAVEPEEVTAVVEPEEVTVALPDEEETPAEEPSRFSELKFGSDYDIAEDESDEDGQNPFRKTRR